MIRTAARTATLYQGSRWLFVERDEHSAEPREIPPTIEPRSSKVAQLTTDGNVIVALFDDLETAATHVGLSHFSSIDIAIKRHSVLKRFRWAFWDDCSEELRATHDTTGARANVNYEQSRHETWVRKLTMDRVPMQTTE